MDTDQIALVFVATVRIGDFNVLHHPVLDILKKDGRLMFALCMDDGFGSLPIGAENDWRSLMTAPCRCEVSSKYYTSLKDYVITRLKSMRSKAIKINLGVNTVLCAARYCGQKNDTAQQEQGESMAKWIRVG